MKRKYLVKILALVLAGTLLAGCGNGAASSSQSSEDRTENIITESTMLSEEAATEVVTEEVTTEEATTEETATEEVTTEETTTEEVTTEEATTEEVTTEETTTEETTTEDKSSEEDKDNADDDKSNSDKNNSDKNNSDKNNNDKNNSDKNNSDKNNNNKNNNNKNDGAGTVIGEKDDDKIVQSGNSNNASEAEKLAKKVIDKIITKGMSDFEKTKAIHDYMVVNIDYDYKNYLNNTIPYESYTSLGALKKKYAVCAGYAKAFQLLCDKAGLDCIYVTGDVPTGSHAWNQVKIDGKWYNVDVTWDDPVSSDKKFDDHKYNRYSYFLISDKEMYQDHTPHSKVNTCSSSLVQKAYEAGAPWAATTYPYVTSEAELRKVVKKAIDANAKEISMMFSEKWMTVRDSCEAVSGMMMEFVIRDFEMASYSYVRIKNTDFVSVTYNINRKNNSYTKMNMLSSVDDIKKFVKSLTTGSVNQQTVTIAKKVAKDDIFYQVATWAFDKLDVSIGFSKTGFYVSSQAEAYHVHAFENTYDGSHHTDKAYRVKKSSDILKVLADHADSSDSFRVVYRYGDEIGRLSANEVTAYVEKKLALQWAKKYCNKSYQIQTNDYVCVMEIKFRPAQHNYSATMWEYDPAPTCVKDGKSVLKCADCKQIIQTHQEPATGEHETYWKYDSDTSRHLACKHCKYKGETLYKYGEAWGYFDDAAAEKLFKEVNKRRTTEEYMTYDPFGNLIKGELPPALTWDDELESQFKTYMAACIAQNVPEDGIIQKKNVVEYISYKPVESIPTDYLFDRIHKLEMLRNSDFKKAVLICFIYDSDGTGLKMKQSWSMYFSE